LPASCAPTPTLPRFAGEGEGRNGDQMRARENRYEEGCFR
jgi:hypothetical protein